MFSYKHLPLFSAVMAGAMTVSLAPSASAAMFSHRIVYKVIGEDGAKIADIKYKTAWSEPTVKSVKLPWTFNANISSKDDMDLISKVSLSVSRSATDKDYDGELSCQILVDGNLMDEEYEDAEEGTVSCSLEDVGDDE